MKTKILVRLTRDVTLSKTRFVHHVVRVTPWLRRKARLKILRMVRNEVIILPPGGQVMPYFKDSSGWKVVLVRQYRPAVKNTTIEGAGGRLENETAQVALSRELKEETKIKVVPELINIVFEEFTHPSILSASVFGGIVEITKDMVEDKTNAGNGHENEKTQVEIFELIDLLKRRDRAQIKVDLLTSRLLDEVAKVTGFLLKTY